MTELGEKAKKDGLIKEGFNIDKISKVYHSTSVMKHKDINKLVNLHKFFHISVRYPFLDPLIRQLIRLPVNAVFIWIGLITFGYVQLFKFHKIKFREAIALGILSIKTKSFTDS